MRKLNEALKKVGALSLATLLVFGGFPVEALAASISDDSTQATEAAQAPETTEVVEATGIFGEAEATEDPTEAEVMEPTEQGEILPAFVMSETVDGVKITVSAEEGVFPEGATLSVSKPSEAEAEQAEAAAADARGEAQNVAISYTYDIKVLDTEGVELQPADQSKVKVSFELDAVADANLETNIYHITQTDGLVAEKLSVDTQGDVASAETDGFSYYTVEFTYNQLQYVLDGDDTRNLSEILSTLGLSGEVSEVSVSDSSLFSVARNEQGAWIVTAQQAFESNEWMRVTIDGIVYEIQVTDSQTDAIVVTQPIVINNSNRNTYNNKTFSGTYNPSVADISEVGILVIDGGTVNLTIKDLNVNVAGDRTNDCSGIMLTNGATLNLTVQGDNAFYACGDGAGICVPHDCTLNITAASTGTVSAHGGANEHDGANYGGAGIGSSGGYSPTGAYGGLGSIVINGGTIYAYGGLSGYADDLGAAGIGSAAGRPCQGSVTINGGIVNARGYYGNAAIGGAISSSIENITITGGTVTATTSDDRNAASIGPGYNTSAVTTNYLKTGNVVITGGTVTCNSTIGLAACSNQYAHFEHGICYATPEANVTAYEWYNYPFEVTIYDDYFESGSQYNSVTMQWGDVVLNGSLTSTTPKKATGTFAFSSSYNYRNETKPAVITLGTHTWNKSVHIDYIGERANLVAVVGNYTQEAVNSKVTYLDENGNEQLTNVVPSQIPSDGVLGDGWYAVCGTATVDSLSVTGTAHLILLDGADLTVTNGSSISDGAAFHIYGQTRDADMMGKMKTTGCDSSPCGIYVTEGASLVINGGNITANAFRGTSTNRGAAIGGWSGNQHESGCGNITINDGIIYAKAVDEYSGSIAYNSTVGAGISGRTYAGNITINGGKITANGYIASGGQATTDEYGNNRFTQYPIAIKWTYPDDYLKGRLSGGQTYNIDCYYRNSGTNELAGQVRTSKEYTWDAAYRVRFDANRGGSEYEDKGVAPEALYELPECMFTPEIGKVFDYWLVGNKACRVGESVLIQDNTVIKAVWKDAEATAPTINTQPEDIYLTTADTAGNTLTVSATAAEDTTYTLSYQWYKNTTDSNQGGTAVSGAISETYEVPIAEQDYYYYCKVTAQRTDNNRTASVSSETANVRVVNKTAQNVSFADSTVEREYGDTSILVALQEAHTEVSYTSSDETVATVDATTGAITTVNIGTAVITATAAEDDTYARASASYTLQVMPRAVSITGLTVEDKVYDQTTGTTISGTPTLDRVVDGDSVTVTSGTATFADANAGEDKEVVCSGYGIAGADAAKYVLSGQPSGITATIQPKTLTDPMVVLSNDAYNYNAGTTHTPTLMVMDGGALDADRDYEVNAESVTSAESYGTYRIIVDGIGNYTGRVSKTWYVMDGDAPTAKVEVGTEFWNTLFGQLGFNLYYNAAQSVRVTAEDETSGLQSVSYFITDSAEGPTTAIGVENLVEENSGWTDFDAVEGNRFTGTVELPANDKYVVYVKVVDQSNNITYVNTNGLVLDGTAPSITGVVDGNEYHREVMFEAEDDYLAEVTLQKAGDPAQNLSVQGTQAGDTVSDIGNYTITAKDRAGNTATCTFTISKVQTEIIPAQNANYTYVPGETYDVAGLFTIPGYAGAATYTITADAGANAGAGSLNGTTLTISKAGTIRIHVETAEMPYATAGSADAILTVSRAAGNAQISVTNVNYGEQPVVTVDSTTNTGYRITYAKQGQRATSVMPTHAGSYTATVIYEANDLYAESRATAQFTIAPIPLTVQAQGNTKLYGQADPTFTYDVTGLLTGDSQEAVLQGTLAREAGERVGTYGITQGTLTVNNDYVLQFTSADFTVTKADAQITVASNCETYQKKYGDETFALSGITNNVGAIPEYTVTDGTDVIRLFGDRVKILKPGTAEITVTLAGNDNYNAATPKTITVTVAKGVNPPNKPAAAMNAENALTKVSQVTLPEGWSWKAGDANKDLEVSKAVNAVAVYTADDSACYEEDACKVTVAITRLDQPGVTDDSVTTDTTDTADTTDLADNTDRTDVAPANTDNRDTDTNGRNTQDTDEDTDDHTEETQVEISADEEGWDGVLDTIADVIENLSKDTSETPVIVIQTKNTGVVPKNVLTAIQGKDVTIVLELANGISWSINGLDVVGEDIGDIDFTVDLNSDAIPVDIVNKVTGERYSMQISLAHSGEFGFSATLTVNLDKKNSGLYANLFYYNPEDGSLEFICADEIDEDGDVALTFTHASDYTIVIDSAPMGDFEDEGEVTEEPATGASTEAGEVAKKSGTGKIWWIIAGAIAVATLAASVFVVLRKRR